MCVIRRHFLACKDITGGSELSAGGTFFHEIKRPFRWVLAVRWRNHYFVHNNEALPCVRPWAQLSASPRTVLFRWVSFGVHVDHAAESTRAVDDGEAPDWNDPEKPHCFHIIRRHLLVWVPTVSLSTYIPFPKAVVC